MTTLLVVWLAAVSGLGVFLLQRLAQIRKRQRKLAAEVRELAHAKRLDVRRRQCMAEAQRLASALPESRFPPLFPCEFGEDVFLWLVFAGQRDGFFIECGGYDGVIASASYPFEAAGWDGLMVEPMPHEHALCTQRRPFSKVVQAALGAGPAVQGATATLRVVEGTDDSRSGSYLPGATRGTGVPDDARIRTREIEVPLSTMDAQLDGLTDGVDFLVLDVEGAELDVLRGFSLERYRPRLLLIEDLSRGTDPAVPDYLSGRGYRRVARVGLNDVYVPTHDDALLERISLYADRPAG